MTDQEWDDCNELSDLRMENAVLKDKLAAALAENTKLAEQVPHWISVKDRLPERNVPIIFMLSLGEIIAGEWDGNEWRASTDFDIWVATNSIPTHWMPLPEPPKEENHEIS